MDNESTEVLDNSLTDQEAEQPEAPEQEPEEPEVDIEELKKKAKLADDYKKRAEKAEKQLKSQPKSEEKKDESTDLSPKDIIFFSKTTLEEDDIDRVMRYAKFEGISTRDAYAKLKPVLDVEAEERRTASATNAGGGRRSVARDRGEDYLSKAEKTGEVPTTPEGMRALAEARLARIKKK